MKLAEVHARLHAGSRLHDKIAGHTSLVPSMLQYHPHGGVFDGLEEQSQLLSLHSSSSEVHSSGDVTYDTSSTETMSSQSSSKSRFSGDTPLRVSPLQEFDWHNATDRKSLRRIFQNLLEHPETITDLQPFVIRGGAASWRACMRDGRGWTVDELVRRGGGLGGLVRVAPTLQFPYVMPAHADDLTRLSGTDAVLPSATRQVRRQTS